MESKRTILKEVKIKVKKSLALLTVVALVLSVLSACAPNQRPLDNETPGVNDPNGINFRNNANNNRMNDWMDRENGGLTDIDNDGIRDDNRLRGNSNGDLDRGFNRVNNGVTGNNGVLNNNGTTRNNGAVDNNGILDDDLDGRTGRWNQNR